MLLALFINRPIFWRVYLVPYGVYLLPSIPTKGLDESQAQELMDRTYKAMAEIFDKTAKVKPEDLGSDLRKKSD